MHLRATTIFPPMVITRQAYTQERPRRLPGPLLLFI